MIFCQRYLEDSHIAEKKLEECIYSALSALGRRKKVLIIPPDFTRYHSKAGIITFLIWQYYKDAVSCILPALGTHSPMTQNEIQKMFGPIPPSLFKNHNFREDTIRLGEIPSSYIKEISNGAAHFPFPIEINKICLDPSFDLIISIGQVVPHEVLGMASYTKNILIGTGGAESINKSHFLGAVCGMEKIMGRTDNPVRKVLNLADTLYLTALPIVFIHTVIGQTRDGSPALRGLCIGNDIECYHAAAELSLKINVTMLSKPLKKVVVYLDQDEYKSTWLGNKSIYRTRMALQDNGELIILAPGIQQFGEDPSLDRLIRKYGYRGTEFILEKINSDNDLRNNLCAAAHCIHGSSENRFTTVYCPGAGLTKDEIESVNFKYQELEQMLLHYNPQKLQEGYNILPSGEELYFIPNPGMGLWVHKDRFIKNKESENE